MGAGLGASLSDTPQTGQSPAQSARQRSCAGSASASASCAQALSVEDAVVDVGAAQLLVVGARLVDLARVDRDLDRSVGPRQRTQVAGERGLEAQPQRVAGARARDVEPAVDGALARTRYSAAAELERARVDAELEPRSPWPDSSASRSRSIA